MSNTIITNDITIGKGVLINLNCTIGHDCVIKDFVELCPNVNVIGHVKIVNRNFLGTSATILPNITIGDNCIIGAGSVVTKDVPDNCMAVGVPAQIKKTLTPLDL
jgi:acetyltransferase-like isoleucine patch superfamily enzyme